MFSENPEALKKEQNFLVVLCLAVFISHAETQDKHLERLKKEFPFGLITDDYGILNVQDLRRNACIAMPSPFSNRKWSSYPIWQCFEVKNTNFDCEIGGRDEDTKEMMAMMVIFGARNGENHEFVSRRPLPLKSCRLYQKDWRKFTQNEKYVCLSGSSPIENKIKGKLGWDWVFGRYKTRKGCDSYFADECEPRPKCKVMPPA